jgi:hypothetical protein
MATTKDFDSYDMQVSGGNTGRVALVKCYKGNSFVGRVDFQADGTALSSDFLWHPSSPTITSIVLQMPMSRFDVVVNTLRQERALKLHIDVDYQGGATTDGHGHLPCAPECRPSILPVSRFQRVAGQ